MALVTTQNVIDYLGGAMAAADQTTLSLLKTAAEKALKDYLGYWVEQKTDWTEYHPLRDQSIPNDPFIEGFEVVGGKAVAYGGEIGRNRVLQLRQLPVRSITSIHENSGAWDTAGGSWSSSDLLTDGSDYQLDMSEQAPASGTQFSWTGFVFRRGSWSASPRAIRVIYSAGLTSTELDNDYPEFKLAALDTIAHGFNQAKMQQGYAAGSGSVGPVSSESLADWSISYAANWIEKLGKNAVPAVAMRRLAGRVRMSKYLGPSAA